MIIAFICLAALVCSSIATSDDLKKDFLDAHNKYRRQIAKGEISGQSSAADMMDMVLSS